MRSSRTGVRGAALAALLVATSGCSSAGPARPKPLLAFFGLELKQLRVDPKTVRRLEETLPHIAEELEAFQVVPSAQIRQHLRGKKGRTRACLDPPCQVRVGRQVSAAVALALRVEQNMVQQCDVYASLYDLNKSGSDQRSRARAACSPDELRDSIQRAACRVLVSRGEGTAAAKEALHRDCLIAAELLWLGQEVQRIHQSSLKGSPEQLVIEERRLAEQTLALKARYQALSRAGSPRWSVAADCRTGGLYEAFAASMTSAAEQVEVPRSVQQEGEVAVSSFRRQMQASVDDRAKPLRSQARDLYRACLKRAAELKVETKHTEDAKVRLEALQRR